MQRECKSSCCKKEQAVDDYIKRYEKFKVKMQRFETDFDLGEHIHGLSFYKELIYLMINYV